MTGVFEVKHHTQFISELIEQGRLGISENGSRKVTFHDPCYLGRYGGEIDAPRDVIRSTMGSSASFVEIEQSVKDSFCCGAVGGNMWYEMDDSDRMNLARVRQASETGAKTVATACSFCMIMMDDAVKVDGKEESVEVKDVAEILVESL